MTSCLGRIAKLRLSTGFKDERAGSGNPEHNPLTSCWSIERSFLGQTENLIVSHPVGQSLGPALRDASFERLPMLKPWPPRAKIWASTGTRASRYFWKRPAITRDAPRSSLATSRNAGGDFGRDDVGNPERARIDHHEEVRPAAQPIDRVGRLPGRPRRGQTPPSRRPRLRRKSP